MRLTEAPLPEIRLVDLEKRFRDVVAVDRISLRIETGEFFSARAGAARPPHCG
jgi:ABC-type sugar transport system ATPase subunit